MAGLPGVSFGVKDEASANGEAACSMSFELEVEGEDEGDVGLPNGKHLRRLVGRWFSDSQSSERFKVAQAMVSIGSRF